MKSIIRFLFAITCLFGAVESPFASRNAPGVVAVNCTTLFESDKVATFLRAQITAHDRYSCGDGACRSNVDLLIQSAKRELPNDFDANLASIINMYPSQGSLLFYQARRVALAYRSRFTARGRAGIPFAQPWFYHVALLYDGIVYDFDFAGEPLKLKNYLQEMFLPPGDVVLDIGPIASPKERLDSALNLEVTITPLTMYKKIEEGVDLDTALKLKKKFKIKDILK